MALSLYLLTIFLYFDLKKERMTYTFGVRFLRLEANSFYFFDIMEVKKFIYFQIMSYLDLTKF